MVEPSRKAVTVFICSRGPVDLQKTILDYNNHLLHHPHFFTVPKKRGNLPILHSGQDCERIKFIHLV